MKKVLLLGLCSISLSFSAGPCTSTKVEILREMKEMKISLALAIGGNEKAKLKLQRYYNNGLYEYYPSSRYGISRIPVSDGRNFLDVRAKTLFEHCDPTEQRYLLTNIFDRESRTALASASALRRASQQSSSILNTKLKG